MRKQDRQIEWSLHKHWIAHSLEGFLFLLLDKIHTHQINTDGVYALLMLKKMFSKRIKEEKIKTFERRLWKRNFDEKTILESQKMSTPSEWGSSQPSNHRGLQHAQSPHCSHNHGPICLQSIPTAQSTRAYSHCLICTFPWDSLWLQWPLPLSAY